MTNNHYMKLLFSKTMTLKVLLMKNKFTSEKNYKKNLNHKI